MAEEADVCIDALDKRFFAGRRLISEVWDGRSKFHVEETTDQEAQRIKQWQSFLDDADSTKPSTDECVSKTDDDQQKISVDSVSSTGVKIYETADKN